MPRHRRGKGTFRAGYPKGNDRAAREGHAIHAIQEAQRHLQADPRDCSTRSLDRVVRAIQASQIAVTNLVDIGYYWADAPKRRDKLMGAADRARKAAETRARDFGQRCLVGRQR